MKSIYIIAVGFFIGSSLLDAEAFDDQDSIQILAVHEDYEMPTTEEAIKKRYTDKEGNPIPVVFRGVAPEWTVENLDKLRYSTMRNHHLEGGTQFPELDPNERLTEVIYPYDRMEDVSLLKARRSYKGGVHNHRSVFLWLESGEKTATFLNVKYAEAAGCDYRAPEDIFFHVGDCSIDILNLDLNENPELRRNEIQQTTLNPGDVLYIPTDWLHQIHTNGPTRSISYGF